jgi:hypothetical protein
MDFLQLDLTFQVLICTRCQYALVPGTINAHLATAHRASFKQFLCFAFRAWTTTTDGGLWRAIYGDIQFSQPQEALMACIWAYLDGLDGPESPEIGPEIGSEIGSEYDLEIGPHPESDPEISSLVLDWLF